MSYIENLISDVERTHKNFGNLVAILQIAVKARKFVLIISPSGCGKSKAMQLIGRNTPDSYAPLNLSIAALRDKTEQFNSFRSVIIIDDISAIQGEYGRVTTLNTLSYLVHEHRVEPAMHDFDFCIEDFYGSALIGIQPKILQEVMLNNVWDTQIADKSLRYYHMYRPIEPCLKLPTVNYKKGLDIDSVFDFEPDYESNVWKKLTQIGESQWSIARTKEHLTDMLKAIAALENRLQVIESDYLLLLNLIKPMLIENVVAVKDDLEGDRILDKNLLSLLVEYYTYNGQFTLAQIARDFKIKIAQTNKIMHNQNGNWLRITGYRVPTVFKPSKQLVEMLKAEGLEL